MHEIPPPVVQRTGAGAAEGTWEEHGHETAGRKQLAGVYGQALQVCVSQSVSLAAEQMFRHIDMDVRLN
jgi:hypothetical protein